MVYQSIDLRIEQSNLNHLVRELIKHLTPHAKVLSSQTESEVIRLLLEEGLKLTAFDLYNQKLGVEALEVILKTIAELESKRREQKSSLLNEIQVYLLAKSFPEDILFRIPLKVPKIHLFEWSFIRSKTDDAILVREVTRNVVHDKMLDHMHQSELFEHLPQHDSVKQELSTPELIAFVRLGMELRGRHYF